MNGEMANVLQALYIEQHQRDGAVERKNMNDNSLCDAW